MVDFGTQGFPGYRSPESLLQTVHRCSVARLVRRKDILGQSVVLIGIRYGGPAAFAIIESPPKIDPAFVTVLACERMLNVAQSRIGRGVWICAFQPSMRIGIIRTQGLQPSPRRLPEVFEGAHETFLP
jgi:hypothetical protein